jgi:hypothetical protein
MMAESGKFDFEAEAKLLVNDVFKNPETIQKSEVDMMMLPDKDVDDLDTTVADIMEAGKGFVDQSETSKLYLIAMFRAEDARKEIGEIVIGETPNDMIRRIKERFERYESQKAILSELVRPGDETQTMVEICESIRAKIISLGKQSSFGDAGAREESIKYQELLGFIENFEQPETLNQYYEDNFSFKKFIEENE